MGASCVMMGSMLAGVTESPGEFVFEDGLRFKHYVGTASHVAIRSGNAGSGSSGGPSGGDDDVSVVSGVAGTVLDKGSVHVYLPYLAMSVRHGLQDMGVRSLALLWERLHSGALRFELRSPSAQKEGGVHDLHTFSTQLYASAAKK
jgi:IMP dehydrogenase